MNSRLIELIIWGFSVIYFLLLTLYVKRNNKNKYWEPFRKTAYYVSIANGVFSLVAFLYILITDNSVRIVWEKKSSVV